MCIVSLWGFDTLKIAPRSSCHVRHVKFQRTVGECLVDSIMSCWATLVVRASSKLLVYMCIPHGLNYLFTGHLREGSLYKTWLLHLVRRKECLTLSLPKGLCSSLSLSVKSILEDLLKGVGGNLIPDCQARRILPFISTQAIGENCGLKI